MVETVLEKAFCPNSIAVVGASGDPYKIGNRIVRAILEASFDGDLYPVNIKGGNIYGFKVYKNIRDIQAKIDLALIAIPAKSTPAAVKECGIKGIPCAIIYSSGFGEIQNNITFEEELVRTAKAYGVRILGPNTNGIRNLNTGLNATFAPKENYKPGNVALVCQSGGYNRVLLKYGTDNEVGFSKIINLGNSSDLSFCDAIEFLREDHFTKVITLHMEGLKQKNEGRKLLKLAKEVGRMKPIIAFKVGKTQAGRRAAFSHTGSLTNYDEFYDAMFKQAGIIRVSDGIEMINVAKSLCYQRNIAKGKNVAILTSLGGPGAVAAEVCENGGLLLDEPSEKSKKRLSKILSTKPTYMNPIDLAADAYNTKLYVDVLSILLEDNKIHAILLILFVDDLTNVSIRKNFIKDIINLSNKYIKPIVACVISPRNRVVLECMNQLEKSYIPCYNTPEESARAMVGTIKYALANHITS